MDKKGDAIGENILMMYRLIIVAVIAFAVVGVSTLIYTHDVNVRDVEARILAREILNCVNEDGFNEKIKADNDLQYNFLDVCGFNGDLSEVFVRLIYIEAGQEDFVLQHGDSGSVWVKDIVQGSGSEYDEYEPGYYRHRFSFSDSGPDIYMEVLINADV